MMPLPHPAQKPLLEQRDEEYPGIEFTPPEGLIGEGETEGEVMAQWVKAGDKYTIVSLDGKPIQATEPSQEEPPDMGMEIDEIST